METLAITDLCVIYEVKLMFKKAYMLFVRRWFVPVLLVSFFLYALWIQWKIFVTKKIQFNWVIISFWNGFSSISNKFYGNPTIIFGANKPFGRHMNRRSIRITIFMLHELIRCGCWAVNSVSLLLSTIQLSVTEQIRKCDGYFDFGCSGKVYKCHP